MTLPVGRHAIAASTAQSYVLVPDYRNIHERVLTL